MKGSRKPDQRRRRAAQQHDPRTRELTLRESQTALNLRTIANERLPSVSATSYEQYQSVVTSFPGAVGRPGQSLLHDTFDANLQLTQSLFDPSRGAREGVERAQLARNRADVLTDLYSNRQHVNASFFQVAELSARHEAMLATITDLEAQARVAATRVREGAALPSEELALRAELLRRRQSVAEFAATRRASLEVLADLTGKPLDSVSTLGNNFSQVVFQFRVTPDLLWTGLKWALGIGLVGGLFPALRAARLPVTEALRAG